MVSLPITSDRALAFLPINTWTEVVLLSSTPNSNDVYIVTTEDKMKKRLKDMDYMSGNSEFLEKVKNFKVFDVIAVEVDRKWYRGKLINFNGFKSDNTMVELIDVGTLYHTKLQNLFVLPYFLLYEPLALPIKFKNFIPTTTKLSVKPLFSECELSEGFVLVDVKCNNSIEELGNNGQHEKVNVNNCSNSIIELNSNQIEEVNIKCNGQHEEVNVKCNSQLEKVNVELDNSQNEKKKLFTTEDINTSTSFSKDNYHTEKKLYNSPLQNEDHCIIMHFEDLTSIYVCKVVKNAVNNTYDISNYDFVLKTAADTDKTIKNDPVVGNIVKVYSSKFCDLYRAKILKNNYDGSYNVFYIDFGNIETVQSDVIFELADELTKKHGLVVKIGLGGCGKHIQEIPEKLKNMFHYLIDNEKPFVIEFDETSKNCLENVKLKDLENGSYINNYILDNFPVKSLELKDIIQTNKRTTLVNDQVEHLKNNDVVYLKHFEDMANIYIVKNTQLFNEVMLKLNIIRDTMCKTDYNKGDIVGVVTESCIYRAKINSIDGNSINVTNIDFGNYDLIQPDSIIVLPDSLEKIPGLAIRIGINKPTLTKTRALLDFINKTEKTPLYLEFDGNSNEYQEITLRRKDNLENIFEEFLKIMKHETASGEMLNKSCDNNEENILKNKMKECSASDFQNIILKNGDYCIVAYFKDLENIYLSKAVKNCINNEYEGHNVHIILKTINSQDRKTKTNLVIGDIVKVFSPSFQGLYRAEIINIVDNTDFHVSYLDFGNTEIIQSSDIFELSDELKIETRTPIRVSIKIPSNSKETDEIEKIFTKLIDDNVVLSIEYDVKGTNGLENIILKELKSGNSVNEEVLKSLSIKMPIKNFDSCILSHFENFNCIYVNNPFEEENAKLLKSVLESTDDCITKTNLVLGDIVKVYSHSYQGLYRAKILQIVNNVNFNVFYIDFGNTEVVQLSDIFELSDNLKNKPGIAIKVGINVPCNVKINEEITQMLVNLCEKGEQLSIEFDEFSETGLENCILKEISSGNNINDEVSKLLSSHYSVVSDKSKKNKEEFIRNRITNNETVLINSSELDKIPSNTELKSGDVVFCSHFEDFNHIYLCKSSKNAIPESYCLVIDSSKEKDIIVKKNLKRGEIVTVKFDDKIVRAELIGKSGDAYNVFLIDIGKHVNVFSDEIFEISNDLKNIPSLVKMVGLKGTIDFKITEDIKNYFYCLWYNKPPVPLILIYDEGNFNYMNEVSLKKQSDGLDIIEDLLKICNTFNDVPVKLKPVLQNSKMNGSTNGHCQVMSGDHVEFLLGYNVDNIFVRHVTQFKEFKPILDQLKIEKSDHFQQTSNPKVNDMVLVYSLKHDGFYRAKLIGIDEPTKFKCCLSDFGIIEIIHPRNIFVLPFGLSLTKIPIMVFRVALVGLNRMVNNNKIKSFLGSLAGKTLILEFGKNNDEPWFRQVVLKYMENNALSINEEIQILLAMNAPISQQQRLERKIIIPEKQIIDLKNEFYPIKNGSSVFITHFESFSSIYIRDASFEFIENFSSFNKQMLKYFRNVGTNNCKKEQLHVGVKVCVRSLLNNVMYSRAVILSKNDNEYNVFYLDYGNKEIVDFEEIFELPKELEKYQNFVQKVQLQNMPQTTEKENDIIKDHFRKKIIIPNSTFIINFNEFKPNGLEDVILKTAFYNTNLVDEIKNLIQAPLLNITTGKYHDEQSLPCAIIPYPSRIHNG